MVTLVKNYALFNRHATFHLCEPGQKPIVIEATGTIDKWSPSSPTSPHWYTFDQLRSLIAAYINQDRQTGKRTTVREFVSNFRGLSGTQKQKTVTELAGLSGAYLDAIVTGNDIDEDKISSLLVAMKMESKEDKPTIFGAIGEEHMLSQLVKHAYIADRTFEYRCKRGVIDGRPYVLEVAFGVNRKEYGNNGRLLSVGLNWTPTLYNPIRGLADMLGENQADQDHPVAVAVHLSYPSIEFTDRGKSSATLHREIQTELTSAITAVTKNWKRLVNQHAKQARLTERQIQEEYKRERAAKLSITDACRLVVEEAVMAASSNNTWPANARQVMYAARRPVLAMIGQFFKNSKSFTQEFLPDFQRDNPELTKDWDVVYDDRGHLTEPHTGHSIGLGTINVRNYISEWHSGKISYFNAPLLSTSVTTRGPSNRYKFVLFIEKEGFNALLSHARIAEKYDIAIQSTKGQTVTAARQLAAKFTQVGVTVLVLHDFDKSGIEIVDAYRNDTRRYQYEAKPNIIDIGLSLADALDMGLQSELVSYQKGKDPRENLRKCGATKEECNFLVREGNERVGWSGERIELNAMTSQQFIDFIERKLIEHGVTKVIPNRELLETAYINAYKTKLLQDIINKEASKVADMVVEIPDDLTQLVSEKTIGSTMAWDAAINSIAIWNSPDGA